MTDQTPLPEMPVTWRPLGVRLAAVFFGLMLFIVCLFAWIGFDQEVRDAFTFLQKLTLVLFGIAFVAAFWIMGRCRLTADVQGLTVVNGTSTRTYGWDEIGSLEFEPGTPWARLGLADGTVKQVIALQASDGDRTARAVREARALLEANKAV